MHLLTSASNDSESDSGLYTYTYTYFCCCTIFNRVYEHATQQSKAKASVVQNARHVSNGNGSEVAKARPPPLPAKEAGV
jgi:hypothetical protein